MRSRATVLSVSGQLFWTNSSTKASARHEFPRQYDGAAAFHIDGRNWMQAYSFGIRTSTGVYQLVLRWPRKTRTVPAIVAAFDIGFTIIFSPKKITNDKNPVGV